MPSPMRTASSKAIGHLSMEKTILYSLIILLFCSCDNSKWETIDGQGINDEPKSIENVIYFEDENNGVVGGYTLINDSNAQNDVKLSEIPTLYLTTDAGKNWREIHFDAAIKQSVRNAYIHSDTLICQTDSLVFFSTDKGINFHTYKDSIERNILIGKYLKYNESEIKGDNFEYKGIKYSIKDYFKNDLASVIVCYGQETLTDYYFVSFDNEKNWRFLQKDFGDNRKRFLLSDKCLYRYKFPFGLQKLSLK
jgi:hypothetical protein